ncbi:MAG: hypothetical protein WEE89_20930 [Gemmatimonadota bacterium]
MNQPAAKPPRSLIIVLAAVIAVILFELLSYAGLFAAKRIITNPPVRVTRILQEQSARVNQLLTPGRRELIDSLLGWRYRPGYSNGGDVVNAQGIRSLRPYDPTPKPGVTRVAAFGDSFVYANEVDTREAWSSQLEQKFPGLEVLNFGVGGYGLDQALLRYQVEGKHYDPHYSILGFVPDDLRRVVNVYRRFISSSDLPLAKPRFVLVGDSLVLIPSPLRDTSDYRRLQANPRLVVGFGSNDQWYRPEVYSNPLYDWSATVRLGSTVWGLLHSKYLDRDRLFDGAVFNPNSAAFRIHVAIFDAFVREVQATGGRSMIVFFPDRDALISLSNGNPPSYSPLRDAAKQRGFDVIDLASAFPPPLSESRIAPWFAPGGHYSALGNQLVAEAIGSAIQRRRSASRPEGR